MPASCCALPSFDMRLPCGPEFLLRHAVRLLIAPTEEHVNDVTGQETEHDEHQQAHLSHREHDG